MPDEPQPTRSLDELAEAAVRRGYQLRRRDRVRWTVAITVLVALVGGSIPFLLRDATDVRQGLVDEPGRRRAAPTADPGDAKDEAKDGPIGRTIDRVGGVTAGEDATPEPAARGDVSEREPLIAFVGQRESAVRQGLLVMAPDGSKVRSLEVESYKVADPAWSPDGDSLAYVSGNGIYTFEMSSRSNDLVTPSPRMLDSGPSWSPDGRRIVFASRSDTTGSRLDILVMNTDGTARRRLTSTSTADESEPEWSPDGRSIVFARNGGGDPGIFVMRSDGSDVRRLTTGQDLEPTWSPDGASIAFTRYNTATGTPSDIYSMRSDGSGVRNLTSTLEIFEYKSAWSPDGTMVAYTRDPDGRSNPVNDPFANAIACTTVRQRCQGEESGIYVMRADGSGVQMLTGYKNGDTSPAYRPT